MLVPKNKIMLAPKKLMIRVQFAGLEGPSTAIGSTLSRTIMTIALTLTILWSKGFGFQASVPDARRPRPQTFAQVGIIEFSGPIDHKLTRFFEERFERARSDGVDLLIIEIDSPGGLKIESLKIARALRDCDWAYTVALISNEAISGGALVSLGCDEIHIDPNAKFGDIGEIGFDMETFSWRLIEPKIESYLSRDARDLAESKGRPADLAEAMVDKDVLVFAKNKGNVDGAPLEFKLIRVDDPPPAAPWQMVPETGPERFLTVSGQRAIELGIAQHASEDRSELLREFGVAQDRVRTYRPTTTDTAVYYLNNPFITGLLVLVGLIALYIEFSSPGIGAGGLVAGLCAALFFWSRFLGGTSGWLEVVLFAAGLVFLLMEIFVIPGFGVAGVSGLALLFASVVLAGQDFTVPQSAEQWNETITSILMILCSGFVFLISAAFISRRLHMIPIFNRLVLTPQLPDRGLLAEKTDDLGKPIPQPHPEISVGDWGKTESLLRPAGRAKFAGHSFDVISDGAFVEAGKSVKVLRIHGNIITVAEIEDDLEETQYRPTDADQC
jgi:membrane-bound serine protease (ClpP class)